MLYLFIYTDLYLVNYCSVSYSDMYALETGLFSSWRFFIVCFHEPIIWNLKIQLFDSDEWNRWLESAVAQRPSRQANTFDNEIWKKQKEKKIEITISQIHFHLLNQWSYSLCSLLSEMILYMSGIKISCLSDQSGIFYPLIFNCQRIWSRGSCKKENKPFIFSLHKS